MGFGEEDALAGKAVDVGGFGLGVSPEGSDPVVEVVEHDNENVGFCVERKAEESCEDGDPDPHGLRVAG